MSWMDTQADLGKVDGTLNGLTAVLLSDGELYVFAALDTGDRIFRAKKNDEVFTATMRLTTRSRRFAWTDLDGDGRVDLVSWNGKTIALWRISKAGTFERADGGKGFALRGCIGLAPCALHKGGTPAVVVSTPDFPFLLHRQDGGWVRTALPMPRLRGELLPTTCACIVADLDGDGWWDALQPRPVRGYLWKGGPTGLTGPEPSTVTANGKDARFTLGDFNGDGALDVFCADEKTNALWENDGKATFQNVTAGAGSLSYKLPTGASDCLAADLNHDGRTDLALLHPKGAFSYHFNRGFRCLGEEGELRLPGGSRGQWAGVVADCNCDGSLDLVVALSDGRLRCYYNAAFEKPILRVALKKGSSAPVTVSVWQGKDHPVCGGAFPVGAQPAWTLFTTGKSRRGTLKYRLGDSPERTQTLRLPPELPDRGYDVTLDGAYAPRLLPKAP